MNHRHQTTAGVRGPSTLEQNQSDLNGVSCVSSELSISSSRHSFHGIEDRSAPS